MSKGVMLYGRRTERADKITIYQYLKEIDEKNEELRHRRVIRNSAIAAVFAATVGGLLAWTLNGVVSDAKQSTQIEANREARDEVRRYLDTDLVIARIRASLKLAESSVIEALGVTGAARRTTSDVQDDIKNLQGTLQQSREVVAALKNLNHTYQDIATNPKFQEGVTAKVIADIRMQIPNIISQSFEFVVRTSGLVL